MTRRDRALVVDGAAALQEDLDAAIVVVPQRITVGDTEFVDDGSTGAYGGFYSLLRRGEVTSTATPSPGSYLEAFRRCEAEHVLCLPIPERWSAMHSTATLPADLLAEAEGRIRENRENEDVNRR